jgi:hypothetical protein
LKNFMMFGGDFSLYCWWCFMTLYEME